LDIRGMLKVKVKVGNITNLSDARYCAGMSVDMLGFPFDGPNAIDPKKFKEITDWVAGPEFVLEILGQVQLPEEYKVAYFEIDASQLESINTAAKLIVRMKLEDWPQLGADCRRHKDQIDYILLDVNLATADKMLITQIAGEFPVLVGYHFNEGQLAEVLQLPVVGIALNGSTEAQPGLKDYSQLSEILEALEVEN
jgi:phosphoribosylanthranilate isomerase